MKESAGTLLYRQGENGLEVLLVHPDGPLPDRMEIVLGIAVGTQLPVGLQPPAGAKDLAKLVNLERLQMGSREATGVAVEPLVGLKNLRELDLHDGQATMEGVRNASRISSLRVLRVHGGALKDESSLLRRYKSAIFSLDF